MNALWMVLACFLFASMGACVKLAAEHFNVGQTVFARGFLPILLLGAWIVWHRHSLRSNHWKSHLYRSTAGGVAMLMYFSAIAQLPLATAMTLNNTLPLWMAALLSLRQAPPRHVLFALLLGLAGVTMLLQPEFSRDQWIGGVLALASAILGAIAQLNLRELGRAGEPGWRTVFIFSCANCLLATPLMLTLPAASGSATLPQWLLLLGVGLCGGLGQLALTHAFTRGTAIVTASMGYSTVVFSSLYGALLWGDRLSLLSWLGIVTIIIAGLISSRPATRAGG